MKERGKIMRINEETKTEVREVVINFFAEECEVEVSEINDNTNIIHDLDGDSLMLIELIEIMKKKYKLEIKLQSIGKYLIKNRAETLQEILRALYQIFEYGDDIVTLGE